MSLILAALRKAVDDFFDSVMVNADDPVLRAIAGSRATFMFCIQVWVTMYMVFLTRDLPTPEKRLAGAAVVMTQLAELAKG